MLGLMQQGQHLIILISPTIQMFSIFQTSKVDVKGNQSVAEDLLYRPMSEIRMKYLQRGKDFDLSLVKYCLFYRVTLSKIHTPPVEDFGKMYHRGSVNFQVHIPAVWFLD